MRWQSFAVRNPSWLVLLLLLLSACAMQPATTALPRIPWSSLAETLAAIDAWPDGRLEAAPLAIHVAIPEELGTDAFDQIHRAIRARGYGARHSEPSMLDPTTNLTARLALADPVATSVFVTAEVAQVLWQHGIPFGIEAGNSHTAILPRRAVPLARGLLEGLVPPATRWPAPAANAAR